MPVENIYWNYASGFYAYNTWNTWSLDIWIPSQTAYAFASLTNIEPISVVFCGIPKYYTMTDLGIMNNPTGVGVPNFAVPAIFDNNVVMVAFLYGATNSEGSCSFQILGFG